VLCRTRDLHAGRGERDHGICQVPVAGGHLPYGLEQRLQPSGLVLHAGIRPDPFEQCQAVAAARIGANGTLALQQALPGELAAQTLGDNEVMTPMEGWSVVGARGDCYPDLTGSTVGSQVGRRVS